MAGINRCTALPGHRLSRGVVAARRHARGDLSGQPVPAQFGRRHRARPRARDRPDRPARSGCCRARSSSPSRPRKFRSASRSTATGRSAACWSARRSRSSARSLFAVATTPAGPDRGARPDGARLVLLSDGAARALCAPLSARALHAARRHPDRRSAPSARCSSPRRSPGRARRSAGARRSWSSRACRGRLRCLVAIVVREDGADRAASGRRRDLAREPARRARSRAHARRSCRSS